MFTGIIQVVMPVISATPHGECVRVRIKKPVRWKLTRGQSVAVDGVCSTVISLKPSFFEVEYMPETLAKTTVKLLRKGSMVNLGRPLTLIDPIDGGLIQGHVDVCGTVRAIEKRRMTKTITVTIPKSFKQYIALKGSIAINGVSLTVARIRQNAFVVALIPYTLAHTNLGSLKNGDAVNVEIDVIARYVAHILKADK
ncbi:MAG: riboflavin synthase [Patescibacteria group bacterium]